MAFSLLLLLFALQSLYVSHVFAVSKSSEESDNQRLLNDRRSDLPTTGNNAMFVQFLSNFQQKRSGGTPRMATTAFAQRGSSALDPAPSRVLLGIFTAAKRGELKARMHYRKLFQLFYTYENRRVCSLAKALLYQQQAGEPGWTDCELVYTFVLGGNQSAANETNPMSSMPATILPSRAMAVQKQNAKNALQPFQLLFDMGDGNNWTGYFPTDYDRLDMTFLNIAENMNHGKSPSWFYYAHGLVDRLRLDYVAKCDSDTVVDLKRYFHFATKKLPPAPWNQAIYAGKVMDKLWWGNDEEHWKGRKSLKQYTAQERHLHESMVERYSSFLPKHLQSTATLHLYMAGQFYLLSTDLVQSVAEQLANPQHILYTEGDAEDHDISSMIYFHQRRAIQLVMLSPQDDQFWEHPFKFRITAASKAAGNMAKTKRGDNAQAEEEDYRTNQMKQMNIGVPPQTVRQWALTLERCQVFLASDPWSLLCSRKTQKSAELCTNST
ncbi:hypothetical protein ACA910_007791 [Epithemia clementina (nom. ined.)]